jgi:hypothetical protein
MSAVVLCCGDQADLVVYVGWIRMGEGVEVVF